MSFTYSTIQGKCLECSSHAPVKACTIRAAPISCRAQTHLSDLEKRSERSRGTSPPFYLTITDSSQPPDPSPSPLSLCLYVFHNSLHCRAQPVLLWQPNRAAFQFPPGEHGEDALRAPGFTLGEIWEGGGGGGGGGRCAT